MLTSCIGAHSDKPDLNAAQNNLSADISSEPNSKSDQWQGEGDCYKIEMYNTPMDAETPVIVDLLVFQEKNFCVITSTLNPEGYWLQYSGEKI